MNNWIKCSEKWPEPYETVLVTHRGFILMAHMAVYEEKKVWALHFVDFYKPSDITHWHPMPDLPDDYYKELAIIKSAEALEIRDEMKNG